MQTITRTLVPKVVRLGHIGPNPTLTLLANSQNPRTYVGDSLDTSRSLGHVGQFASRVNTRVTSRQLVCPLNTLLEQSELLRFRAPPAYGRGWSSLGGAGGRSAPEAGVER